MIAGLQYFYRWTVVVSLRKWANEGLGFRKTEGLGEGQGLPERVCPAWACESPFQQSPAVNIRSGKVAAASACTY